MTIGERIKYLRESQGMTQKKLADSIHVSASLMNRIEKGSPIQIWIVSAILPVL